MAIKALLEDDGSVFKRTFRRKMPNGGFLKAGSKSSGEKAIYQGNNIARIESHSQIRSLGAERERSKEAIEDLEK